MPKANEPARVVATNRRDSAGGTSDESINFGMNENFALHFSSPDTSYHDRFDSNPLAALAAALQKNLTQAGIERVN